MVLPRLVISNLRARKVRVALTVVAIVASVSLVVAVTSGYATMQAAAYRYLDRYMGSTDAMVVRTDTVRGGIDRALLESIAEDDDVRTVTPRLELLTRLPEPKGAAATAPAATRPGIQPPSMMTPGMQSAQVVGIRLPHDAQVVNQRLHDGGWFDGDAGNVAVIDQVAAEKMKVKVGDTFDLTGQNGTLTLRVVGVVHKPSFIAQHLQTVYVPLATLQRFAFPQDPQQYSRLRIDLEAGADARAFAARWRPRLEAVHPMFELKLADETKQQLEQNFQGVRILSLMGGTVSMLAAAFIIFSTLSMGVAERQRTLAMLRAIGAFRGQLGWLVVLEGLLLSLVGVAVGVPLGWLWVKLLFSIEMFRGIVSGIVVLDPVGVAYGAGGSVLAALVASFIPAWTAMRTDPLSAMAPLATPARRTVPVACAVIGLLLLCLDPLILFSPLVDWFPFERATRRAVQLYGHFLLGIPGVMFGFFLLAPLFVKGVERFLGPLVAAAFGLRFALLRQQLSTGVWRAAGTGAALMVGLAVLIAMNTQGTSALSSWKLPDKFPDVFLIVRNGLTLEQVPRMAAVDGVRDDAVMPIAIASPKLGSNFMAIAGAAIMPDATMFFGMDPDKMLTMMELDFRQGTPERARELLKTGRHVVITQELNKLKGLGVGDAISLQTPMSGTVDYTVAGVVWSPGMDVMASRFDMGRQLDQRTAASVFGSMDDAVRDFGVKEVILFAANLDYHVEKEQVVERLREQLKTPGIDIADVRQLKHDIQEGLGMLLLLASTVAYAAMAVASVGVTNTIMASIRSRRWQFGVLRAVGVTRGQLLRLVVAEAVLLGGVGATLGLVAGLFMAVNANRLSLVVAGFQPPIAVPWDVVAIGVGVVMLISLLASLWPAAHVARAEPLALLQAGRAAA